MTHLSFAPTRRQVIDALRELSVHMDPVFQLLALLDISATNLVCPKKLVSARPDTTAMVAQ
jgi:hypothetical protein